MDVNCLTCGEPWDVFHLREEIIWETDLSDEDITAWEKLAAKEKLNERYRESLRQIHWEFGAFIIDVRRCPCCPTDQQADPDQLVLRSSIAEMVGDDEDGLAATLEDV